MSESVTLFIAAVQVICVGLPASVTFAVTNELAPPSLPTGCACPGDSLNYTCTVVGGSVTIWSGTAFDCVGNQIALLHSQFGTSAAAGACGSLSATGDSATDTSGQVCYSSTLTVPVSVSLNGLTVGCDREPPVTVSGSPHTLSVAGIFNSGQYLLNNPSFSPLVNLLHPCRCCTHWFECILHRSDHIHTDLVSHC